ncbi:MULTISPECIES: hypothetical protein, partial [Nostocaceae]
LFNRKHFSRIPFTGNDFLAPVRIVGIFFSIVHTPQLCNETISRTSRNIGNINHDKITLAENHLKPLRENRQHILSPISTIPQHLL